MLEDTIKEYHERRKHLSQEEAGEAQEQASEDIIKNATEQALNILKENAGTQFDPNIVKNLVKKLKPFKNINIFFMFHLYYYCNIYYYNNLVFNKKMKNFSFNVIILLILKKRVFLLF